MAAKPDRISRYVKGIGERLDGIANEDVTVLAVRVGTRPMQGSEKSYVELDIADANGEAVLYHAWSDSLAEKLADIPAEAFPLTARFFKTRTGGGFEIWNVE